MEVELIRETDKFRVTATYLHGELFFTRTCIKDKDGFAIKVIDVYTDDGFVSQQEG